MPTLFVYLPCYNEAGNLRRLTEEWLAEEALARTGYQLTVIPVDDRSTDDTLAIARQLAQEQARVRVIAHAVNQNLGGCGKDRHRGLPPGVPAGGPDVPHGRGRHP